MQDKPKMVSITFRVPIKDLAEWQKQANLRGLSISEWMRRACNSAILGPPSKEAIRQVEKAIAAGVIDQGLREKEEKMAEQILTEGRAIGHHPRCTCLACKPEKKK